MNLDPLLAPSYHPVDPPEEDDRPLAEDEADEPMSARELAARQSADPIFAALAGKMESFTDPAPF